MTFRDLIRGSLKLLGVVAAGENPSAQEQSDGLATFNDMLDSWSTENLIIYSKVIEDFTLIPSQSLYTMGPSGNFDTTRPLGIDGAAILDGTAEFPLDIYSLEQWRGVIQKTTQSTFPTALYYNETFPLLSLNIWPVPSEAKQLRIYSWKALTSLANVNASFSFPPGYNQALKYSLAALLAPEYGKQVSPDIAAIAAASVANIKRMNSKLSLLGFDPAIASRQRYNILTGGY